MSQNNKRQLAADLKAGIIKRFVQVILTIAFQAAILLLGSGRLNWVWAWVFIGLHLVGISINATVMLRCSPETVAERANTRGAKEWDKVVAGLGALMYFVVMLLVAALDERFGWTGSMRLALHMAGLLGFVTGSALFGWAMVSNAYFAGVARIQQDPEHRVCTTGPYRYVRHPGYLGMVIQSVGLPLMLGSFWSLIPGGVLGVLMAARTALEDRMLHQELEGYREYAQRVRYRLLRRVW